MLADPRVRLGVGVAALLATAGAARRGRVKPWEAAAFKAVNGLPDSIYRPVWVVMQLGALGAVPAAAATAWLAGDHKLAGRFLAGGTVTWGLSKLVKQMVGRPRPVALLQETRHRGREATGLGYLSGHGAVAVALGAAALPRLGPAGRALVLGAIPLVGLSRVYIGAHLPLDIAGGAALGLAVDAAVSLVSTPSDVSQPARTWPGQGPSGRMDGYIPSTSLRIGGLLPAPSPSRGLLAGGAGSGRLGRSSPGRGIRADKTDRRARATPAAGPRGLVAHA